MSDPREPLPWSENPSDDSVTIYNHRHQRRGYATTVLAEAFIHSDAARDAQLYISVVAYQDAAWRAAPEERKEAAEVRARTIRDELVRHHREAARGLLTSEAVEVPYNTYSGPGN